MLEVNESSLRRAAQQELTNLLGRNPFAFRMAADLGAAFHRRLVDWEEESESTRFDTVESLYLWLVGGWSLDPDWLAAPDGTWLDDQGNPLPADLQRKFSGADQLAAYGLWLVGGVPPANLHDLTI